MTISTLKSPNGKKLTPQNVFGDHTEDEVAQLDEILTQKLVAFVVCAHQVPSELQEMVIDMSDSASVRNYIMFSMCFANFLNQACNIQLENINAPSALETHKDKIDPFLADCMKRTFW